MRKTNKISLEMSNIFLYYTMYNAQVQATSQSSATGKMALCIGQKVEQKFGKSKNFAYLCDTKRKDMETDYGFIYDIISKAYKHYKCLQYEDFYLHFDKQHEIFEIHWPTFMDKYIDMNKVYNVAKFVRKYSKFPIYNSFGIMDI